MYQLDVFVKYCVKYNVLCEIQCTMPRRQQSLSTCKLFKHKGQGHKVLTLVPFERALIVDGF